MTIEVFAGERTEKVLVTVEASELDGYGVTFSRMSLSDPHTRALLRDLIAMVTRMGLRSEGERVRVDCTCTGGGGCALLISRAAAVKYLFDSGDDIIAAYAAGALPEGIVSREGERWVFAPEVMPDEDERLFLGQFCSALPDEDGLS